MVELLNNIDIAIFRFINSTLSNPILDFIMPILTDLNKQPIVLIAVVLFLIWMMWKGNKVIRLSLILLIILITITDQVNSFVIKHWFERLRPCHVLHGVNLLVGCGSGYSFPSSHAVNNFAGAFLIAYFFPKLKWWFIGYALLVAFSRVYVGVHYPFDVISGSIIGAIFASALIILFLFLERIWYKYFAVKRSFR